jgi:hypothetical protein
VGVGQTVVVVVLQYLGDYKPGSKIGTFLPQAPLKFLRDECFSAKQLLFS